MRCKPNDLAVIIRGENVGVLVDVIELHGLYVGAWRVRVHSDAIGHLSLVKRGETAACYDSKLQPIRDPGDDARDETLDWLPVPSRETEHA